jgi:hypothetical protein
LRRRPVHHASWVPLNGIQVFDSDMLLFGPLGSIAGPELLFFQGADLAGDFVNMLESGNANTDPSNGFVTPDGTLTPDYLLREGDFSIVYHDDTNDVQFANFNYDNSTGVASFDWWLV